FGVSLAVSGTVINAGSILGVNVNSSKGIVFNAGGSLTNQSGGYIGGRAAGVASYYDPITIDNSGTIHGQSGIALETDGSVTNEASGSILGVYNGIYAHQNLTAVNYGYIHGSLYGVKAFGANDTLESDGTISGGFAAVALNGSVSNRLILEAGAG